MNQSTNHQSCAEKSKSRPESTTDLDVKDAADAWDVILAVDSFQNSGVFGTNR
jgi:hypothetical protein